MKRTLPLLGVSLLVACGQSSAPSTPLLPTRAPAVEIIGGDNQTDTVGQQLPLPILVRVVDTTGGAHTPVQGQSVSFVVTAGGGAVFAGYSTSDSLGRVQERWTLGDTAQVQTLEARAVDNATGAPLTFAVLHATALPGPLAAQGFRQHRLWITADSTVILPEFARDAYGNPLPVPPAVGIDSVAASAVADSWAVTPDRFGARRFIAGSDTLVLFVTAPQGPYRFVEHRGDTTITETGIVRADSLVPPGQVMCAQQNYPTSDSTRDYWSTAGLVVRTVAGVAGVDTVMQDGTLRPWMCHPMVGPNHPAIAVWIRPLTTQIARPVQVLGKIGADWVLPAVSVSSLDTLYIGG